MEKELERDDKLSVEQNGEETMATVPCVQCGLEHVLINNEAIHVGGSHLADIIKGVFYCGMCDAPTVFSIKGNATNFLPGKLLSTNLNERAVAANAKTIIREALKCFYGGSFVGVVAMCRSAVVEAILSKRIGNRNDNVPGLVEKAKKAGLIDAQDEVRGISAGLIAREALHYMGDVNEDDALFAIRAAVEFVNNVSERTPSPASP